MASKGVLNHSPEQSNEVDPLKSEVRLLDLIVSLVAFSWPYDPASDGRGSSSTIFFSRFSICSEIFEFFGCLPVLCIE